MQIANSNKQINICKSSASRKNTLFKGTIYMCNSKEFQEIKKSLQADLFRVGPINGAKWNMQEAANRYLVRSGDVTA